MSLHSSLRGPTFTNWSCNTDQKHRGWHGLNRVGGDLVSDTVRGATAETGHSPNHSAQSIRDGVTAKVFPGL